MSPALAAASHVTGRQALNAEYRRRFRLHCRPQPRRTGSQWAAEERILNGAPWRNDTAPYLTPIMDAITDRLTQEVTVIAPSQSGKTEVILNTFGFYVHQEPSPMLLVQPTVEMGERFSKERIAGMIRETPALARLIAPARSRDQNNTTTSKSYPGGQADVVGANAPAGLAMSPKRVVLLDERDRHPRSAGSEGDVKAIARARTRRFRHRRKIVEVSSPTDLETSLIYPSYCEGTQEVVHWPCLACDTFHAPRFEQLRYDREEGSGQVLPQSVRLVCPACQNEHTTRDERAVKQRATPIQTATPKVPHKRSFWIHGLIAAFHQWAEIAQEFVTANEQRDPAMRADMLRAFFNTTLGELFVDTTTETAKSALRSRARRYDGGEGDAPLRFQVPREAGVLTAGVDVQHDRFEIVVRAWGVAERSWLTVREILRGDTSQPEAWVRLEQFRTERRWRHESGVMLPVRAMAVDAGDGAMAKRVYEYCAPRLSQHVYAIKGSSNPTQSLIPSKFTKVKPGRLYVCGVNGAMDVLYRRLQATEPGPGYLHLNEYADDDYVTQLLSMRRVVDPKTRKRKWEATPGVRNEVPDCEVYAYLALLLAVPVASLASEVDRVNAEGEKITKGPEQEKPVDPPKPTPTPSSWLGPRRGGWMR